MPLRGKVIYLQDILSTVGHRMTVQLFTIHILLCICHYFTICIYPAENIPTSAGDHLCNTRECQTPHHRPEKKLFSTVPCNSHWQWTVELLTVRLGAPLSTVSGGCTEQLKTPSLLACGVAFVPMFAPGFPILGLFGRLVSTPPPAQCTVVWVPNKSKEE